MVILRYAVTGEDARLEYLKRLLLEEGHELTAPEEAEVLVPPPWDETARYAKEESFLVRNAALTARGAAALLEERLPLPEARVLVLGFGRVGKLTALELKKHGAAVTAADRSASQRAWAEALGFSAVPLPGEEEPLCAFDVLVNTVPAPVLGEAQLRRCRKGAVLLELASAPFGIDGESARAFGMTYIRASGLPGKLAPREAAEAIRAALHELEKVKKPRLGIALTGSHCCLDMALTAIEPLRRDYDLVPILSYAAGETDTRFGAAADFAARLEALCGKKAIRTVPEAEPLGTREALSALLVIPCTGNTLGKLSHGITDTPVTMACKAHLRNGAPLILAISTNDGLSGSAENIGILLQRKNVYFVPFRQDAPEQKPFSLQSDFSLLGRTVEAALQGRQLQPVTGHAELP